MTQQEKKKKRVFVRTIQQMNNKGKYKDKVYTKQFLYIPQELVKRFDIEKGHTIKMTVLDNDTFKLEIERI